MRPTLAVLAVLAVATPRPAEAGVLRNLASAMTNARARIGRAVEVGAINAKLKMGLLPSGRVVKLKERTTIDAHGKATATTEWRTTFGGKVGELHMSMTGDARASKLGRGLLSIRNAGEKLAQKMEIRSLERQAARGELREGQLVKLETRSYAAAYGGERREKIMMQVVDGKLRRETSTTSDRNGPTWSKPSTFQAGTLRRSIAGWAAHTGTSMADAQKNGLDPLTRPGFEARQAKRDAAYARFEAQGDAMVPHAFLDKNGNKVLLKRSLEPVAKYGSPE